LNFPRSYFNGWTASSALIALLVLIPLAVIVFLSWTGSPATALNRPLLGEYVSNTFLLALSVLLAVLVIGTLSAFLVVFYKFPGRKTFEWLLVLPLSIPAYLMAFSYTDFLGYSGSWYHFTGRLPDIMNFRGAVFIFSMALYPYVYLPLRFFFRQQGFALLEAGASLGCNRPRAFLKVLLPVARPAIAGGLLLVLMEVLNDYGVVKYFGIPTFTVGIFRTWFSLGDISGALKLASLLLLVVMLLILAERYQRRKARFFIKQGSIDRPFRLRGAQRFVPFLICTALFIAAFVIPVFQMAWGAFETYSRVLDGAFYTIVLHSVSLAAVTAFFALFLALLPEFAQRLMPFRWLKTASGIAALGYAVPGAIIAIGILYPAVSFDKWLFNNGYTTGIFLTSGIWLMLYALTIRFLAVGLQSLQAGYATVSPSLTGAARSLGHTPLSALIRVDVPLLRNFLFSGFILVFVDVLKELPLSLILRPFNFDTLATKAFSLASDELLRESANASLLIVVAGLVPLLILNRFLK
jgi:iron(III) transport system permease protein